ncbi:MAG: hypothetical protein JW860_04610 [Sedimentisphaerales bacterium]|nr:hypothetical protein [Sedimentisphaerales bacterium]
MLTKALIMICCLITLASGEVMVSVFEPDGCTPFDGRDLMVGSTLTLIVSSNDNGYWNGGLFVAGIDRDLANVYARGWDPNTGDWAGSRFDAAGNEAIVWEYFDSWIWGIDMYTDENAQADNWFIVDYHAVGIGDPNVGFYDYNESWDEPRSCIYFHHSPSRDFNNNDLVNLEDFYIMTSFWLEQDCRENSACELVDLDLNGIIEMNDLFLFSEYWLWGASAVTLPEPPQTPEPNEPPAPVPDLNYYILDSDGHSEITLSIGETTTLFVDMVNESENDIQVFYMGVLISDPNYGSIDNRPYDADNPPGPGTARILAQPRDNYFDYWGPCSVQYEGIEFIGASLDNPVSSGHLAGFDYSSEKAGDVILDLIDLNGTNPTGTIHQMTIHQIDPNSISCHQEQKEDQQLVKTYHYNLINVNTCLLVQRLKEIWTEDDEIRDILTENEWKKYIHSMFHPYKSV